MTDTSPSQLTDTPALEFWFDPSCPFTWLTSRWLVDLSARLGITVQWRLMSLSLLSDGQVGEAGPHGDAGSALRALAAAEDEAGQEGLAKLYTLIGTRTHDSGEALSEDNVRRAVTDAGLPDVVADAGSDAARDDRIATSHHEAQQRAGTQVGSPVVALDGGKAYFGPVLTAVPTGDDATRLFEAIRLLASVPTFSEIKTSRS